MEQGGRHIQYHFEFDRKGPIKLAFDQSDSSARYELNIVTDDIEAGDGIVLALNPEACVAMAEMFLQLACKDTGHIHLGWSEKEPNGPGFRIEVRNNGRIDYT